jgi:NAD(P)-dependent dehydrogenase (short-subunit alcohol dehydrogenase family)
MRIEGRSVVSIGGSSGMGLAIAMEAVDAGVDVTIAGRSRAKLEEARQAVAGDVAIRTVDVSDEQSVKRLFSEIGLFDHLVVTDSSVRTGFYANSADARASMDSKFWGHYTAARYAQIRPKGSITFLSGILSRRPLAGLASLAAINAAVEALSRALLREQGIELAIPITEFVSGVPVTFIRDPEGNLIEIFPEALRRSQVAPNAPAHLGEEKRGRTDDEQSR